MRFQALSIGIEVPIHCFSGTVHSVFRRSCNVWLESHRLLTLLPSDRGNSPYGVRLNVFSQFPFFDRFRIGQRVACRGGILRIEGTDCSVDLRQARLWYVDLKDLDIDFLRPAQDRSWAVAWSELNTHCRRNGLAEVMKLFCPTESRRSPSAVAKVLLPQAARTVLALLHATRNLQRQDTVIAARPLIGLGPGLTPSGDDFLVGYLAGLWCTARGKLPRMQFLNDLTVELSEAASATNPISRAPLQSVANGHVSESISTLAQRLHDSNNADGVRTATQAALRVGRTSGSAGVLGLLLGCTVWQCADAWFPEPMGQIPEACLYA